MTQPLSRLKLAILTASVPTATLLIGVPGAGKSTWLDQAGLDMIVLSTDDLLPTLDAKMHGMKAAHRQMMAKLHQTVSDNQSFIVDRTNISRSVRRKILSHVPPHYLRYAAVFALDRKELDRRLSQREGKIIPATVVDDMLDRYEMPSKAEFDEIFLG